MSDVKILIFIFSFFGGLWFMEWLIFKKDLIIQTVYRDGRFVDINPFTGKIVNDSSKSEITNE